ncbi:hypothetical protein MKZ25_10555 [Solibacillus sp. FSL W7-1464]|uniref:hypothetical protein n=1 Tax=Solibacillus sp. FSL W7-1464 TaxID=2921706 RepID=UPI0030F94675
MELGTIKSTVLQTMGWLSVVMGLISLAILNISLLSEYDLQIETRFSSLVVTSIIIGVISLVNKKSRSLGFWGLGISMFIIVFVFTIFGLSWTVAPFP